MDIRAEYGDVGLKNLREAVDNWRELGSRPLENAAGFDEVFGMLLDDTEEHYRILGGLEPLEIFTLLVLVGNMPPAHESLKYIFWIHGGDIERALAAIANAARVLGVEASRPNLKNSKVSFRDFWHSLRNENVDLANFLDKIFGLRRTPSYACAEEASVGVLMLAEENQEEDEDRGRRSSLFQRGLGRRVVMLDPVTTVSADETVLSVVATLVRDRAFAVPATRAGVIAGLATFRSVLRAALVGLRAAPTHRLLEAARRPRSRLLSKGIADEISFVNASGRRGFAVVPSMLLADAQPFHWLDHVARGRPVHAVLASNVNRRVSDLLGVLDANHFLGLVADNPEFLGGWWHVPVAHFPRLERRPTSVASTSRLFDALRVMMDGKNNVVAIVDRDASCEGSISFDTVRQLLEARLRDNTVVHLDRSEASDDNCLAPSSRADDDEEELPERTAYATLLSMLPQPLATGTYAACVVDAETPLGAAINAAMGSSPNADRIHVFQDNTRFLGDLTFVNLAQFILDFKLEDEPEVEKTEPEEAGDRRGTHDSTTTTSERTNAAAASR